MRLTTENARLYEGKKLDTHRRMFHHYPLEVKKINGEYFVKDSVGVCYKVPSPKENFDRIDFDFDI